MKTPESPLDLDSLLNTPAEVVTDQPVLPVSPLPPPVSPLLHTPQTPAFESAWDGEEILDIPRASAPLGHVNETPLGLEDLLAPTPQPERPLEVNTGYEERTYNVPPPTPPVAPETFSAVSAAGGYGNSDLTDSDQASLSEIYRQVHADDGPPRHTSGTAEAMPAGAEAVPRPSVFAQDSYVRNTSNTYVMATPDRSNKGRLAKVFLAAALAFALLGLGYFALSGLVKDWLGVRKQQTAANQGANSTAGATGAPSGVPSLGATASPTSSKKASPTASPSATASTSPVASATPSAKPSATPAATATPNQTAANKPTPTPAQAGTTGHAVGTGDGSLAVQVASYKSSGEAQQTVARLKSAGFEARVVKADVPGKGTWFRVQTGRFTSESDASKYASELRNKGVARDFIVTGYQNQ